MSSPQLTEYVRQRLAAGATNDTIREELKRTGWSEADVQSAMNAPSSAPTAPAAPATPPTKSAAPKRLGLVIGIVVGILVLAGGASATYFFFLKEDPEKVLAMALSDVMDVKTFEFASSLRVEATTSATGTGAETLLPVLSGGAGDAASVKLLLTMNGAIDHTDRAKPKSSFDMKLASTSVANGSPILGLSTRQLEDATYLSLTEVPSNMFIDLSPIAGVWVKIDPKSLAKQLVGDAVTEEASAPKETITEEQKTEIRAAFVELKPVRVKKALKDEDVDGVPSRHYQLTVDQEALKAFVLRMQSIMNGEASLAYEKFNDDYERYSKQVEVTSSEIWIGKESGLPTRVLLQMTGKATEDVPADGTMTFDMKFKNFNQTPVIEAPAESKTFEEIFQQLMGGGIEMSTEGRSGSRVISEVRQIQTALELAFSETNSYPVPASTELIGQSNSVLCRIGSKSAWTNARANCTGTVYGDFTREISTESSAPYAYTAVMNGQRYELRFMMPEKAGTLEAGPHCAHPDGVSPGDTCIADRDLDGLGDDDERRYGSNPSVADTDGDGFSDGEEVSGGYNPNGPGKL